MAISMFNNKIGMKKENITNIRNYDVENLSKSPSSPRANT